MISSDSHFFTDREGVMISERLKKILLQNPALSLLLFLDYSKHFTKMKYA